MMHWRASSAAGCILICRPVPVCAIVYGLPDSAFRRAFLRAMDRAFEPDHCRRVWITYQIGRALRR